ncbi:glycoside hydrolase family 28 protein [Cellvibrio sp. NN19]|uniref:glycoside hydrolase family 28 protein n=1 Tax=Cellvibrio chitinivorans TaxID=3102792 RepID=UPI002B40B24A|nr:glycoside hydrolase family 28 protein [Cellvibrio sp. NN19]
MTVNLNDELSASDNMNSSNRRDLLKLMAMVPFLPSCIAVGRNDVMNMQMNKISLETPFGAMDVQAPNFDGMPLFNILDFGADQANPAKTSVAIDQAIDAASKSGGVVIVPAGVWETGKIHLKSNVNLHIAEGAELHFSSNPEDYLPAVHSTWEGLECYNYSPLIYAYECENVAITGKGKLVAKLDIWKEWYARPQTHMDALVELYYMAHKNVPVTERDMTKGAANLRPQFVQFNRCNNVLVEDISIVNSPFWVLHPYLCNNVTIRGAHIYAHGHNNDGADPEMCTNVLIENCIFDQGDDAISVKSGREFDAWRLNAPCRNIVIRNCTVKNGHQLLAIGSEIAGGIENVYMHSCVVEPIVKQDIPTLMNLLFIKTNERRGGFVKNIFMDDIVADNLQGGVVSIDTDVLYQWRNLTPTLERRLTPIENIVVSNVQAKQASYVCNVNASAELPVRRLKLENVKVESVSGTALATENVINFQLK